MCSLTLIFVTNLTTLDSPLRPPLSVNGEADVCMLVVQQTWHRHSLVAFAKHLLLDAGRVDVVDQVLQRLQAAAQHGRVAHALAGQAAAQTSPAVYRGVMMMVVVVVEVMVMGVAHLSVPRGRPSCGGAQKLLGVVAVTVRCHQHTVPRRGKVLTH